jgi:hypothetical protein
VISPDDTDRTMAQEALLLAARGFRIIPIHTPTATGCSCERGDACGGSRGKHPRLNAWQKDATTEARTIRAWWRSWPDANIGLVMGGPERLVAVDIDGPEGRTTLARLEAEHGELPATLTSRSGRVDGGEHRFFHVPDALDEKALKNRASHIGPKVDIRTEGGQVVAPPSLHGSGNRYAWVDRGVKIADLPEWLYKLATWEPPPPVVRVPPPPPPATGPRRMSELERARAYLAKIPGAISGQNGHARTLLAAAHLVKGFRLDESSALLLLREWNLTCEPPWNEKELRHKVEEASKVLAVEWGEHLQDEWAPTRPTTPRQEPATTPFEPAPAPVEMTPDEYDAEEAWRADDAAPPAPIPESPPEPPKDQVWKKHGVRSLYDVLHGVYQRVTSPEPRVFVSTGNENLDQIIGGYRPGRITVVGASTSWGKSSYAIMACDDGMKAGKRVLLVSGEDSEDLYGKRIAARRGDINAFRLRDHELRDHEKDRLLYEAEHAERVPFFIDGVGKPAEVLATMVAELCAEQPYDLVVVDYLQAFKCIRRCQDRRNEVTHIARCFVDAIKGANTAGLVLSQIKRLEDGKAPTKHDLKESGDVENMAEHVLMGYCTSEVDKSGETRLERFIVVAKNKDGPVIAEAIPLPFDGRTASFQSSKRQDAA